MLRVSRLDSQRVFEDHPVDGLLAAARGEGAVVVEVLVHQHRQEVDHVNVGPTLKLDRRIRASQAGYP